jgi:hypothetical protein
METIESRICAGRSPDPSDVRDYEVGRLWEDRPHKMAMELTNPNCDNRVLKPRPNYFYLQ